MKVLDVLKLPSMKQATVLAGKQQLNRLVTTVSVLEISDPSIYQGMPTENEYSGNELLLTSFAQIKEEIPLQCDLVRLLHKHDHLGVILYYVGIVMPEVSVELIEVFEECGMVLISMPCNQSKLRYSELISEMMFELFNEQHELEHTNSELLEAITRLPAEKRQIEVALKVISDKIKGSIGIINESGRLVSLVCWPRSNTTLQHYLEAGMEGAKKEKIQQKEISGEAYFCGHSLIRMKDSKNTYELVVFKKELFTLDTVYQVKETVQVALNLFGESQLTNLEERLVTSLIMGNEEQTSELLRELSIEPAAAYQLVMVEFNGTKQKNSYAQKIMEELKGLAERVLFGWQENVLIGICYGVGALEESALLSGLEKQYSMARIEPAAVLRGSHLKELRELVKAYGHCRSAVVKAYPQKRVFRQNELLVIQEVLDEVAADKLEALVRPLKEVAEEEEWLKTLAVFLLDNNENIKNTSIQLFLHKNTVKYRLSQIKKKLSFDYSDFSTKILLYKALIYHRIIS